MEYDNLKENVLREMGKISEIRDENEKRKAERKIEKMIRRMNKLFRIQEEKKKKDILESIKDREIIISKTSLDTKNLKKKWEYIFTKNITQQEKEKIYLSSYLWHAFSYEKVLAREKREARKAFNEMDKKKVIAFYEKKNEVLLYENAVQLKDTDFDMEDDIYLVDPDFQWTYVVTHEKEACGPYFFTV